MLDATADATDAASSSALLRRVLRVGFATGVAGVDGGSGAARALGEGGTAREFARGTGGGAGLASDMEFRRGLLLRSGTRGDGGCGEFAGDGGAGALRLGRAPADTCVMTS
jgi:hypothetical protein